jgi:UPF0755 protein
MKLVKPVLILTSLILIIGAAFSYWVYRSVHTPNTHDKAEQYITIEKGTPPNEIVTKFVSEGIIPSRIPTIVYLRTFGNPSALKAGEYQFSSPITPLQVIAELEKGEERTTKITIPEGYTRFDIAKRIVERFPQEPPVDEKQVLALMDDTSPIQDIAPQAKNLEGYIYPSTYSFPREEKPDAIIKAMVTQFRKIWKPEWTTRAQELGRSPQEIVTIASLVETESKIDAERPTVASVIYNRLSKGIPLGLDQTAVYVAKMQNRWDGTINRSDLEAASPYNTRRYAGLPPGPISSVSESAVNAALNPAQTDYIYYVLNVSANDGSHLFFSSASEFERAKVEYQRWLEQQRREKRAAEAQQQQQ